MERPTETEGAMDPVSRNMARLQESFDPMRRKIERDAQTALSDIDRRVNEIGDVLYRYAITEPLDNIFFNELIFQLDSHLLTKEAGDPNYYDQEQQFVEKCRADLDRRRVRGV